MVGIGLCAHFRLHRLLILVVLYFHNVALLTLNLQTETRMTYKTLMDCDDEFTGFDTSAE